MANAYWEELTRRREALRQEISTIREAIIDVAAPEGGGTQMDKLQNLNAFLSIRQRELDDVEARLAQDGFI
jgi:hypothetical protein